MGLLTLLSSSIVPALLLILVLALALHIVYLNKSFKHRIRLIVAIRMREEALARQLNKPLPSERKSIYALDEKKLEEELQIVPVELYDDGIGIDIIK